MTALARLTGGHAARFGHASPTQFAIVGGLSLVAGLVSVWSVPAAIVLAAATVMAGIAGLNVHRSLGTLWLSSLLLISGLIDAPRLVPLGPVSALGLLTIIFFLVAVPFWVLVRRKDLIVPRALLWYLVWVGALSVSFTPSFNGAQNILVFSVFTSAIAMAATTVRSSADFVDYIDRILMVAAWVAVGLYSIGAVITGFGSNLILGARPFALFALIVLSWSLARIRYEGKGKLTAIAAVTLITLSLSRTALAIALILLAINWFRPQSAIAWIRTVGALVSAIVFFYVAFTYVDPLRARFLEGDISTVGGSGYRVEINVEARDEIWASVWDSFKTSPLAGHGAGTADDLTERQFEESASHPHNDYLRILHDYGVIGLTLWLFGYLALMGRTFRGAVAATAPRAARVQWAAFLGLVAISLAMITDNVMIYIFAMGPLGVLVGLAVGSAVRRKPEAV